MTRDHRTQHWLVAWLNQHDHHPQVQLLRKALLSQLADTAEPPALEALRASCVLFGHQCVRPTAAEVDAMLAAIERASPGRSSPKHVCPKTQPCPSL